MRKGHALLFLSFLMVAAVSAAGCVGTSPAMNNSSSTATATPTPTPEAYVMDLKADAGFMYLSQPPVGADDSITVTAIVSTTSGAPATAGIPVNFSLSDETFARLGQSQAVTNDSGMTQVTVYAKQTDAEAPAYPYLLLIRANANGADKSLSIPMSRHESLSGRSIDKEGNAVSGATVTLLFNDTGSVVRAPGNPTITDSDGRYNFTCLPFDMGSINLVVQKDSLRSTLPVNLTAGTKNTP